MIHTSEIDSRTRPCYLRNPTQLGPMPCCSRFLILHTLKETLQKSGQIQPRFSWKMSSSQRGSLEVPRGAIFQAKITAEGRLLYPHRLRATLLEDVNRNMVRYPDILRNCRSSDICSVNRNYKHQSPSDPTKHPGHRGPNGVANSQSSAASRADSRATAFVELFRASMGMECWIYKHRDLGLLGSAWDSERSQHSSGFVVWAFGCGNASGHAHHDHIFSRGKCMSRA